MKYEYLRLEAYGRWINSMRKFAERADTAEAWEVLRFFEKNVLPCSIDWKTQGIIPTTKRTEKDQFFLLLTLPSDATHPDFWERTVGKGCQIFFKREARLLLIQDLDQYSDVWQGIIGFQAAHMVHRYNTSAGKTLTSSEKKVATLQFLKRIVAAWGKTPYENILKNLVKIIESRAPPSEPDKIGIYISDFTELQHTWDPIFGIPYSDTEEVARRALMVLLAHFERISQQTTTSADRERFQQLLLEKHSNL